MHVTLVAGTLRPTGALEGLKNVTVAAEARDAALATRLAASAGLHASVVHPGSDSDLVLITTMTGLTSATPAALRYDGSVLRALVPGATIAVGSLAQLMPEVDWIADPGGMVVTVPSVGGLTKARSPDKPVRIPDRAVRRRLVIKADVMPKRPVGVRGPVRRVALDGPEIRGISLRAGDVVVDKAGQRWFYRDGELWSHRVLPLPRDAVFVQGRTIRPQRAGTSLAADEGDRVEVVFDGRQRVYGVVTQAPSDATHLWTIRTEVDAAMVSDPRAFCFGARLAANAAECYAAGGVWDRPCDRDTECPYFDPRTGRGGCVSGMCEMPLGVGNLSFRVPDPTTPALCDTDDVSPWCVKK